MIRLLENKWLITLATHGGGELSPSLLAYSILGTDNGGQGSKSMLCTLCQEPDHNTAECTLQSLEPARATPSLLLLCLPGLIRQTDKSNKELRLPASCQISSAQDPNGIMA